MVKQLEIAKPKKIFNGSRPKLTELIELYELGETEIEEWKQGDFDQIKRCDRGFCVGNLGELYKHPKISATERQEWIASDRKVYQRLQPLLATWVAGIEYCNALMREYVPDYDAWESWRVYIGDVVADLGELGLIDWNLYVTPASTLEVVKFMLSMDELEGIKNIISRAFEAGRFDIIEAVQPFPLAPIPPRTYWEQAIAQARGSNDLSWTNVCHYEVLRGLCPELDDLAQLTTPPAIAANLKRMGRNRNADGSFEFQRNPNMFTWQYGMSGFATALVSAQMGIVRDSQPNYDPKHVLEHQAFIHWHNESKSQIGQERLQAIYGLFGISGETINDVLTTLPQTWWSLLGVNPDQQMTLPALKAKYRNAIRLVHPDLSGGDHDRSVEINAAFEAAKKHYRLQGR